MGESLMNEKRKVLLDYKQRLLSDMTYFDSRIKEARIKSTRNVEVDEESSDSDIDLTTTANTNPSIVDLKRLQSQLKTCLQATVELTRVHVLQSQVEVMVEAPVIEGPPVPQNGTWYEVVAECKLDLIHFLITFYVHKSSDKFGPVHYRNVKVTAAKKAHEMELSPALANSDTPGTAVKLVGQFACCHRARRTTLARLADKFGGALHMEPRVATQKKAEKVTNSKNKDSNDVNIEKVVNKTTGNDKVKKPVENSEEGTNKKHKKDSKNVDKAVTNKKSRDINVASDEISPQENAEKAVKTKNKENAAVNMDKVVKKTISKEKIVNKDANVKTTTNSGTEKTKNLNKDSELTTDRHDKVKKTVKKPVETEKQKNTTVTTNKTVKTKLTSDKIKQSDNIKSGTTKNNNVVDTVKETAPTIKQKTIKHNQIKEKSIHDLVLNIDKKTNPNVANSKDAIQKKVRKSIGKVAKSKTMKEIRRGTFNIAKDKPSPKNKIPIVPPRTNAPAKKPDVDRNLTGVSVTSSDRISKIPSLVKVGPVRISPRKSVQMKPKTFNNGHRPLLKNISTNIPRLLKKPDTNNMS